MAQRESPVWGWTDAYCQTEPSGERTRGSGASAVIAQGHRPRIRRFPADLAMAEARRISEAHRMSGRFDDSRSDFRPPGLGIRA